MTGRPRTGREIFPRLPVWLSFALVWLVILVPSAQAHSRHHHWSMWRGHSSRAIAWGSPTDPNKDAALILDGETGRVLYSRNATAQRHPASLTKMMTLYLLFDALKHGQLTMNSPVYVSQHAAYQEPTKLAVPAGSTVPVDTVIRSLVVLSANDMAVAVAEALGGTESHFAELMTQKAHEFGMRDTFYHNASGLPDNRQITTASDLGVLARHLAYDFPQYFHYFSLTSFSYAGRLHLGHDNLLGRYAGADGIKTGYTAASGFNLVSSVVRSGMHVIGIVMGGRSAHRRDMEMMRLLDATFVQISANPQLVARADVPWKSVAENAAQQDAAGFQFSTSGVAANSGQQFASLNSSGQEVDEDTAESQGDSDEIANIITAAPKPQVGAPQLAKPQTPFAPPPKPGVFAAAAQSASVPAKVPDIKPTPRDRNAARIVLAAYQPQSMPLVTPVPRSGAAVEAKHLGNVKPTPSPGIPAKLAKAAEAVVNLHGWTIQIGAFADVPSARAELATYAERSMDVLGQAERLIIPFQGVDGKTLYRARFGPFPEQEARAVCATLTQRGQMCFAATMAAR